MEDFSSLGGLLVEGCSCGISLVTMKTSLGTILCSALTGEGFDFSADCSENLRGEHVSWPGWFLGSHGRKAAVLAMLVLWVP